MCTDFVTMEDQQSLRATPWRYFATVYSTAISKLNKLGKNIQKEPVVYPKDDCHNVLYQVHQLYRHIEEHHPEDRRHTKNYFK